jgi:hypothetical protein
MSLRLRVLSLVCWLAIVALLIRVALAPGTFIELFELPLVAAAAGIVLGLSFFALGTVLVVGFAAGSAWAPQVSRAAATLAIPYGAYLFLIGHQSGSLIDLAAIAVLVSSAMERQARLKEGAG